jgi:Tol biopolymer transport system component
MHVMIHSFDQYAQSHRFWSPDGRYLVYADRDDQSGDRIWLVDTKAEKGADPILIDGGSIGIWSWR